MSTVGHAQSVSISGADLGLDSEASANSAAGSSLTTAASAGLGYTVNTFRTTGSDNSGTQTYLGFIAGADLGNWHVRERGALQVQTGRESVYQNVDAYLQRDLPSLKSQFAIGDLFTDGAVFDSIGVRGVQFGSNDRTSATSGAYAPVIRGVAMSNALVSVTQNGIRLYQTTVAPGPFEIDDVVPTGSGGNLRVTVTEADGSRHSFTVPYASVRQPLKAGSARFKVAGGVIREAQISRHDALLQGTLQYGFTNTVTGYGGVIAAQGYLAGQAGAAIETPVGTLSADVTQARADVGHDTGRSSGTSLRIGYNKLIEPTDTSLSVAAYSYSSGGFLSLREAMLGRDAASSGRNAGAEYRRRNQLQVTLNQHLGGADGTLYVVGSTGNDWNHSGMQTEFQAGYSNTMRVFDRNVNYDVSVSRQRQGDGRTMSNQVFASVSVPLGKSQRAPVLATGFARDSRAGWAEQTALTGSAGAGGDVSYGVFGANTARSTVGGGHVQYRGPYAHVGGSASGGTGYSQMSANLQGSVSAGPKTGFSGDRSADAAKPRGVAAPVAGVVEERPGHADVPQLLPSAHDAIVLDAPLHSFSRTESVENTIAANIATANQTDGAERLMVFSSAVPMKVYARTSGVSLSELQRENARR